MRLGAGLALVLGLAATAASAQPERDGSEREGRSRRAYYAVPSAVIAAELALGRVAREKGQWEAMRDSAADRAVLFAPRAVGAEAWLKRRAEPATPQRWLPGAVWMSCDGGYGVTRGVWTRGAARGEYLAVWQRQKKGE